ncbi:hypothetical protein SCLCIDRAFT_28320 [Scleroderma citrinum Foug A]|uniref:Uncharacterized protein n=1 Tax=Scleroderma citrinum Foug A TaxID=1036808 RepID=A0A0C3DBU3_9AGAM|nr:hypothetical protein SCLCIDRAFT_28320 [Scleroderma citrinum Foug A]
MVDCGEVLKFELGVPGMEPFKERDFVVREEGSLKDVCDPLTLLCVRREVNLGEFPEDDVPMEISCVMWQSTDVGVLEQENDGYVQDDEDGDVEINDRETVMADVADESEDPKVIPLQMSGAIDTDLANVSANELTMWALHNLWNEGKEGGYAVQHGKLPVNNFG